MFSRLKLKVIEQTLLPHLESCSENLVQGRHITVLANTAQQLDAAGEHGTTDYLHAHSPPLPLAGPNTSRPLRISAISTDTYPYIMRANIYLISDGNHKQHLSGRAHHLKIRCPRSSSLTLSQVLVALEPIDMWLNGIQIFHSSFRHNVFPCAKLFRRPKPTFSVVSKRSGRDTPCSSDTLTQGECISNVIYIQTHYTVETASLVCPGIAGKKTGPRELHLGV